MLAGNWPYYTGEPHPGDEMLTARLHFSTRSGNEECSHTTTDGEIRNGTSNRWQHQKKSEQCGTKSPGRGLARSTRYKLECLSSGLEGRVGARPLALLMDQLQHPCVDAGLDVPSLLTWESADQHPEHKVIDHVVLGKDQPGGAWQAMDPNVLTISLNRWMSLPDLEIRQWEMLIEFEQLRITNSTEGRPHAFQENLNACKPISRISIGTVAAYYKDYVRRKGLEKFFRCGTTVTSVRPVRVSNADEADNRYGWMVKGFENKTEKLFRYRCKQVVLATGTTDLSNRLGIPGEDSGFEWVTHDLNDLESRLDRLVDQHHDELAERVEPVLVIGAGLSAADAIIAARFRGIPVLHVFQDSSTEQDKPKAQRIHHTKYDRLQELPSSMYPEYHKVYEMMADGGTNYPLYRALQGYTLVGFNGNENNGMNIDEPDRRVVTLLAPDGQLKLFRVSIVVILIGYKPDLSYLEAGGISLGRHPNKPINSKSNPIEVDDFTYEVTKAPRTGLYALGPLVGDNFVRYILGGAFGILAHILNMSTT
ncbi:oxidative stress-induced growth inhibitor 1 isoform X2 [Ptiloglossa arizonensis]